MKYKEAKRTFLSAHKALLITVAVSVTMLSTACSAQYNVVPTTQITDETRQAIEETISFSIEENFEEISCLESEEELSSVFESTAIEVEEYIPDVSVQFESADVVRIVDGDTLVVHIDGQSDDIKVRLIGVDTPESVAPKEYLERTGKENSEEGIMASEITKSLVPVGSRIYLEKDISDTDRYGRALRYVWTKLPMNSSDAEEIKKKMLQGQLLSMGIAVPVAYAPDTKNADIFAAISHDIQEEKYESIFDTSNDKEEEFN